MRKSGNYNYARHWNIVKRMVNLGDSWTLRRIAFPNIRMDLQFLLFWYNLFVLINIHYTSSLCNGVEMGIATYPQGDINIAYPGNPLEVFCRSEYNYTSKDLYFHIGQTNLTSEVVNDTTIRLFIEQPEPQRVQLYCTSAGKKHCLNMVLVDRPPIEVTDFKCISRNLEVLNCSWTCPNTNTSMTYELFFLVHSNPLKSCQVERLGHKMRYCMWNLTTEPRYRQQQDTYTFILKSKNVFGERIQNFTIDHFSIVKPDSPYNGTKIQIGQHSVKLFWEIPFNMVDFLPNGIDHKIEYQIEKRPAFHQVNASFLHPKRKNYKFNLTGLPFAHYKYEVRVFIRPKDAHEDQFWSDPLIFFFNTGSEIPDRPPDIAPGGFTSAVYNDGDKRYLKVYWNQLEEFEENGDNFTYKVLVTQDNKSQTLFPNKSISLSSVMITKESRGSLHIHVQSYNSLGPSKRSSYLYIPSNHLIINGPKTFTKLAFENGTYELSWDHIPNINNYTLFWCLYNITQDCVGRMNFTTLDPSKTSHTIDLPNEKKYQFAIAANKGIQTSGMVWAKCDISRDAVAMYAFPMQLSHGTANKTSVDISWTMECQLRKGIITGYNITYCPIVQTSHVCDVSVKNESVYIDNPKVGNILINNLLPFRTYRFDFSINTTYGLKFTNATTYVTTLADVPSEPVNVTIYNITNTGFVISWDPPLKKNGNVVRYLIYNYSQNILYTDYVHNLTDVSRRTVTLSDLGSYTNYSLSVVACNTGDMSLCSKKPVTEIFVRTSIGPPSKITNLSCEYAPDMFKWSVPEFPGGIIDYYEVKRVKDNQDDLTEIINSTVLYMEFTYCDGVKNTDIFQVRAVNLDSHPNHGAYAVQSNVKLPYVESNDMVTLVHAGEWSDQRSVICKFNNTFYMVLIFITLFVAVVGIAYASVKAYKKFRKMEDIKPVLPTGLGLSEKDFPKYSYNWNSTNDAGKISDEDLLLPNKASPQTTVIKEEANTTGDNTDSTTLSQTSEENQDQEASTSDEGSSSSLHSDIDVNKCGYEREHEELCDSDIESPSSSPNMQRNFTKNPVSGYVQPAALLTKPYIQPNAVPQMPTKSPPVKIPAQPTTSSYVRAGLQPEPIFTTGVIPSNSTLTGYIHPDDIQLTRSTLPSFPIIAPNTKTLSPENLPTIPNLLPSNKRNDSSYIQLQSLDALPASLKPAIRNTVPLKQPTSSGYISPSDVVINKRINILSGGGIVEDSAVLDPTMSPDAYCRFSWSADPSKDNLTAILAESSAADSDNNQ